MITTNSADRTILIWIAAISIVAKLLGLITWPWLWVLSPIWIPAGIAIGALVVDYLIGRQT